MYIYVIYIYVICIYIRFDLCHLGKVTAMALFLTRPPRLSLGDGCAAVPVRSNWRLQRGGKPIRSPKKRSETGKPAQKKTETLSN